MPIRLGWGAGAGNRHGAMSARTCSHGLGGAIWRCHGLCRTTLFGDALQPAADQNRPKALIHGRAIGASHARRARRWVSRQARCLRELLSAMLRVPAQSLCESAPRPGCGPARRMRGTWPAAPTAWMAEAPSTRPRFAGPDHADAPEGERAMQFFLDGLFRGIASVRRNELSSMEKSKPH